MKRLITIVLLLISASGITQSIVNRASQANTVADARLQATFNLLVPRYQDTILANVPYFPGVGGNRGLDSCGQIIFTYDVNNFWARACNPKRWVRVAPDQVLPDGVYSGGNVAWTGTGLDFVETAAIYVLNGVITNSSTATLSLDASDPINNRIDLIGLGPTGPVKITGVPSANPQEPSYNPQVFIRRAAVLVGAGAVVPTITTQIVYDEDLGLPDEWTPSSNGTVDFANTNTPFHLTIDANVTGLDSSKRIKFNFSDTVNSAIRGSLLGWIRLATAMPVNQNLFIQLFYQGAPVSIQLPFTSYGLIRSTSAQYQPFIFPFPSFGASNIVFDEIRIIPTGGGTFPDFKLDFIQFQTGFAPITTKRDFGVEDNFAYSPRQFDFNQSTFRFNNVGKFTVDVANTSDTAVAFRRNGIDILRLDGTSNQVFVFTLIAGTNGDPSMVISTDGTRVNNGHFIQFGNAADIRAYQYPLFIRKSYPALNSNPELNAGIILENDTLNANGLDSALYHPLSIRFTSTVTNFSTQKLFIDGRGAIFSGFIPHTATADSFVVRKNGYYQAMTLAEMQALIGGGSVSSIATNNGSGITGGTITSSGTLAIDTSIISTKANVIAQILANGTFRNSNVGSSFRLAIPNTNQIKTFRVLNGILADSSTSNTISIQVDSSQYATKAFVNSVAGGGGFTGVTSVSVVSANGFAGSVANSTTTPAITLTTTITGTLKGNGTSISAAAGSDINTTFGSQTQNLFYASPNGSSGTPSFRPIVAADIPTLNQNTTGTAATITGISTVPHGGTGLSTLTAYALMAAGTTTTGNMQQVSGVGTSGQVLTSNGAAALPTWQNSATGVASITGTAGQVIASASTGAVTLSLPQSILTTSTPTFRSLTLGGTAATTPLTFTTNTDAAAAAGRWYYNTTRLGFSLAATILRVPLTNDVTPANGQIPIGNGTNYTVAAISPSNNTMVITNGAGSITIGLNMTPFALTDGATITWNAANGFNARVTLGGSGRTLTITNPVAGATYTIVITQDATGSRTITTWPTGIRWPNGTAPTLTATANAVNIVSFYYNGTNFFGTFQPNPFQ